MTYRRNNGRFANATHVLSRVLGLFEKINIFARQRTPLSTMRHTRSSGILLHITSLPGAFGIGDLGEVAYEFVDFLQSAGQSIWQVLPLSPPAFAESPYSSYSAFAGNELLISPSELLRAGLLLREEVDGAYAGYTVEVSDTFDEDTVDFATARRWKMPLLRMAFERFCELELAVQELRGEFDAFCENNRFWLDDYARFTALRSHFGHSDWARWEKGLVDRDADTLASWDERLGGEIEYEKFVQFVFDLQWKRLKAYANSFGIQIFGDMPIFVAYESADVWANQNLFCLNDEGRQTVVAGVPPDYFSETGQRWGNPLYDWKSIAASDYEWWTNRFRVAFENFDLIRIDHFRGFESYWEVNAECPTAIDGQWVPGPGAAPFLAAKEALGDLPIIAEDLGLITEEVHELRDDLGFPGMRVFQFGYDTADDPYHRPEAWPDHSVVYTGTHDNDTIKGWFDARKEEKDEDPLLDEVVSADAPDAHWVIIRAVLDSNADLAIVPMQDVLGLGSKFRMNTPGEAGGNWKWSCRSSAFSQATASSLRQVAEVTNRLVEAAVVAAP